MSAPERAIDALACPDARTLALAMLSSVCGVPLAAIDAHVQRQTAQLQQKLHVARGGSLR